MLVLIKLLQTQVPSNQSLPLSITMTSNHQSEVQMLNEYIVALEKQIKSIEVQRQSLIQEVSKAEQVTNKTQIELRQLKNQFKQLNTVLYRQNIEKNNVENKFKILLEENDKLKKQNELKDQRITQLNTSAKDKSDQLAKEKNNLFLTTTFHTKQMTALDDKLKEAERKIIQVTQQKNLAYSNLKQTQHQLSTLNQENQKIFSNTQTLQKENQQLQIRIQELEKQVMEINNEKDLLNFNLQINNEEVTKIKYENENLSIQLAHRSLNNEEAQKSFQSFIQNLKLNHEHEIHQYREEIQHLKIEIHQYKDSIESLNGLLNLQRSNFQKQYQKNSALTEDIVQLKKQIQDLKKQSQDQIFSRQTILNSQQKQYQTLMQKWKDLQEELERTVHDKQANEAYLNSKYEAFEMKYADDLRKKIDEIELLNNDFSLKTLQLEQFRYQLSQSHKKQSKILEEVKKKEEEIDSLANQLSLKSVKLEELRFEVSEVEKKLQNKNKEFLEKQRTCHSLLQKQSELNTQIQILKKQVNVFKDEKHNESKKLKKNIEGQDQQIIDMRKRQGKLVKQVKDTEEKIAKMYEDMHNSRGSYQKKLTETINCLNQSEREVQKLKRDLREKEESFKEQKSQYELRLKEQANKQQEQTKKNVDLESKLNKMKGKVLELEKQLEKKENDFSKTVDKISIQQNSELQEIKKTYEVQLKQLESKTREQVSLLSSHLESKSSAVKELELELNKMQMASIQFTSNQSSMEKTISMLQKELDESHKQNNSYHEKLFSINNSVDHTNEQLIEKDIKIISLNSAIQKLKKENCELLNEISMLRTQVDALESSTAYLKKQITSTLDKQQALNKEIRSLKETNKEMTKVVTSNSTVNLHSSQNDKNITGMKTARGFDENRNFLDLGEEFKHLSFKDIPTISEVIKEGRSRATSVRKREMKSLQKHSSSFTLKNLHIPLKSLEDHAVSSGREYLVSNGRENAEELKMIPESSLSGSISSSFYKSSQASRKISEAK